MKPVSAENAVFTKHKEGKLTGVSMMHIGDFLFGGTKAFKKMLNKKLKRRYSFGTTEPGRFKFTGLNIEQKGFCRPDRVHTIIKPNLVKPKPALTLGIQVSLLGF